MNIFDVIKNELIKNRAIKLASAGKYDQAIKLTKRIKSMRTTFMKVVPDEGMFAYELRALAFRLYSKKKHKAALHLYLKAEELIDSVKTVDRIIDKEFETAKNYSDIANCRQALKDIDGARIALDKCLVLLEQMLEPHYLWQGINRQYKMILTSWINEAVVFQDNMLIERILKQYAQVEIAIVESMSETRIVDYWYKWPQVPPISLH